MVHKAGSPKPERGGLISLTFYGGVGEVGGNKVLLESGDTAVFLDFGTSFARRYLYFEEYLKPRPGAGLLDFIEMKLLPPLGNIYREDLFHPERDTLRRLESSPLFRNLEKVDGVFLSHAHLDHSGYISFLSPEIPIFTLTATALISKAMQDSSPSDLEKEVCYFSPRRLKEDYLSSQGENYRRRPFVFLDEGELGGRREGVLEFWSSSPGKRKRMEGSSILPFSGRVGSLELRFFPVDHSIPGACAFALETESGWVGYTGDFRLHGREGWRSWNCIESLRKLKLKVLIAEGTRAGDDRITTEEEVLERALGAVRRAEGIVIADFGPRNVERLQIFHQVALETGRKLVILPKDAYLLSALDLVSPGIPLPGREEGIFIFRETKARREQWEEKVRERFGESYVDWRDIRSAPESFILCFSFWDMSELIDIKPEGGIYIYSSSEAFTEEQRIDLMRLRNWASHFGLEFLGDPDNKDEKLHASGHISGRELLEVIAYIKPQILIPIHTEHPEYFVEHLRGTGIEVVVPEEGERIIIS